MAYLYLATYDLVKEKDGYDYKPLWDAFAKVGAVKTQWSAYLVESNSDTKQLYQYLRQYVDADDRLMVIEIESRPFWSTGFQGTRDLINSHFPQ